MIRVTARQSPTLFAKLRLRTRQQIERAQEAAQHSAERTFARVQEAVPRDTHYMALNTQIRFTDNKLGYRIGWYRSDFVGQINPVTGQVISTFYPVYVIYGTRFMAGRDVLTPAFRAERPNFRKALQRAVHG